jgi:hypothetical protein
MMAATEARGAVNTFCDNQCPTLLDYLLSSDWYKQYEQVLAPELRPAFKAHLRRHIEAMIALGQPMPAGDDKPEG